MDDPSRDPEAEIRQAVRTLLLDWVDPSEEATERFMAAVRDRFTGYGTGPGETYADRDALRAMVLRERAGMSHPFTLDIPWMTVHVLHETTAIVVGELAVTIEMGDETVVERPRFTFALDRHDGRWLLAHFHFSVPDAMHPEGGTMDDLLDERTRQLEAEVARRTAELDASLAELKAAQAQLVQQEKMASLGTLTAGIAHEIKNPLNFVTNFASLSQELVDELDGEADPDERAAILGDLRLNVEKIEQHGRRADGIVRAMMDHARSGSGERRAVDLNALVREYTGHAAHAARVQHPTVGIAPLLDLDPDVGSVDLVPQEIGRVVVNLVGNALDAVRQRRESGDRDAVATVTVSTRRTDDGVAIRVADTGTGMSEAVRARVFEPFFTTKPAGQGTGLGLSLSHDIVALGHRGTLAVESAEGEGTTVTVTLPG
ncbi:sensor histidine kinase [Rubrivirga sp. IMCC45206]|uniref:sensor histidine kinase n=1 Tax=Rubrivirga sp. IMCC45206 TaxID=3391614 RepID=UPI00398F9A80